MVVGNLIISIILSLLGLLPADLTEQAPEPKPASPQCYETATMRCDGAPR